MTYHKNIRQNTTFKGNKNKIHKKREENGFAGEMRDDFLFRRTVIQPSAQAGSTVPF